MAHVAAICWAAGLFEGEGTVTTSRNRRRLCVRMVERSSIDRFFAIVGRGRVYGPYANTSAEARDGYQRSDVFMWVAEQEDADAVAAMLRPHLTPWRRERLDELFPQVADRTVNHVETA